MNVTEDWAEADHFQRVQRKHWGRYLSVVVITIFIVWIVYQFALGNIEWPVVAEYVFAPTVLRGVLNTIVMTAMAMTLGIVIGVVVAIMRLSPNPVLNYTAAGYVWLFRGVPSLLQLLMWFNLALVFPTIGIPGLFEARTIEVMTPFLAAFLGLGINQGAYTSEVVRAGLLSVSQGQHEAASAIGMPRIQALRRIVLPQAMRVIIPPIGNELIGMVKWTSLASVIQFSELLYQAQNIYYVNGYAMELLIVCAIWYLVIVTVLSGIQRHVERYYSRGYTRRESRSMRAG